MSVKYNEMAMVDVAEHILKEKQEPVLINDLIKEVVEKKELDGENIDLITQLYLDITQSAKFVFCGDDLWTLKEGNLDLWDKDGYAFIKQEELTDEADEDDIDFTEFVLEDSALSKKAAASDDDDDDEAVEIDEDLIEESEYIDMELPIKSTDDDDTEDEIEIDHFDDDDYNEDDYNEIMDDYEDMYDE